MKSRTTAQPGFSLLETMIAVVVITIAILGLLAGFAYGISSNDHAQRMVVAGGHASQVMDLIRSNNLAWDDTSLNDADPDTRKALDAAPLSQAAAADGYTRNVQVTQGIGADHKAGIARVVVRVFWEEKGVEKSVMLTGFSIDLTP